MSGRQPKQVTLFTFTYLGNQFKLLPNKVKCAKAGDFHFSWILFLIRKTQKGYVADVCMRDIEKRKYSRNSQWSFVINIMHCRCQESV